MTAAPGRQAPHRTGAGGPRDSVHSLARSIERALSECVGILGLDAASRLSVDGGDGDVRGIDLRYSGDATAVDIDADLTGVVGADLSMSLARARDAVGRTLSQAGVAVGTVRLRVTDIGSLPLSPRR